jgi:hypothetical protein
MANVTKIETDATSSATTQRSDVRFPARNLADSVAVAKSIYEKGGGKATADQLAAYLGYKSTNNGAYLARVGSARTFGLIAKSGDVFTLTARAQQVLMPTYPEQVRQGLVEAFLSVELFRRIFEDFKGKELPPEFGMKNALRNTYKVVPTRVDVALRVLMDSAEDAGFFSTRGARTHLIMPQLQVAPPVNPPSVTEFHDDSEKNRGGGGGNGGGGNDDLILRKGETSLSAVKARYIESLIQVFEEKAKQGDLDETLMSRIEKMLEGQ